MNVTVIVPAFNEEAYLPSTLDSIHTAAAHLRARVNVEIDVIVVDNNSEDETAVVARERGARTVHEPVQGVARARNTGARHAEGDVLVFVDADVIVPPRLLDVIHAAMVAGCGCPLPPRSDSTWMAAPRTSTGMAQRHAVRRRSVFDQVGGYDAAWIGEDVDFYRSLRKFARSNSRTVRFIRSLCVRPSCRRFDRWPLWRVLVWTNPLFIALFRRRKKVWSGWYSRPVR